MNFFKRLFGGKEEPTEQEKQEAAARDFDILKYDGVKAMKMGQWGHAIRCFRHALELSEDLEVRDYLSQSLIRTGELLAANDELQVIAEAQPDNQSVFVRIAQVAYMMENYQAMGDACERAMLIDDSQAVVYLLYAQASQGQGDDANTVAMLTRAIALQPDYAEAYLLRGQTLLATGQLDEAQADAEWLADHVPENEDVMLLKARIMVAGGSRQQAVDIYNKVIELNPFSIDAYRERAEQHEALGNEVEAQADRDKVSELQPAEGTDGSQDGGEDIEQKVRQAYRDGNPLAV